MIFPFLWVFITSFKTTGEIYSPTGAFNIIPDNPTEKNYVSVLFEKGILNAVKNSFDRFISNNDLYHFCCDSC